MQIELSIQIDRLGEYIQLWCSHGRGLPLLVSFYFRFKMSQVLSSFNSDCQINFDLSRGLLQDLSWLCVIFHRIMRF